MRKVTRIFLRTSGLIISFVILATIAMVLGIQTYTFQTWLGKKASTYLSDELGTRVSIHSVELEFFSKANLEGVLILDQHHDTILHGDLLVDIGLFNYRQQRLALNRVTLRNVTSKLIRYKGDKDFNYQFLVDYFDSGKTDTTAKQEWDVKLGETVLQDVAFVYRKEDHVAPVATNINFDDISLKHTYGTISDLVIDHDTVYATVNALRTKEQSGFELSHLDAKTKISEKQLLALGLYLTTPRTVVRGTVDFTYNSWDDYQDFINKVKINGRIQDSSYVCFTDIAAFASELNGLDETVAVSGNVKGYVNHLMVHDLKLLYGHDTRFEGDVTISGLPDVETSYLHFNAKQLSTSFHDLSNFPSYPFVERKKLSLPLELRRLNVVSYKGKFDGFMSDFTAYGTFKTGLGRAAVELSVKTGKKPDDLAYHGTIKTDAFNLGALIGQEDLSGLSMSGKIHGKGVSIARLDAEFEGKVEKITYSRYTYTNIHLNGTLKDEVFSGLLISKDPNADLDFNGTVSFKGKVPEIDFISTINNLHLRALNFTNTADSGRLSSQIFINIKGNNLDELTGQINFDNTIYATHTRTYNLSTFNILVDQASPQKKIKLNSAYINALAWGNYNLSNLKPAFQSFLFYYYPTFFKKNQAERKFNDHLAFTIQVKKFNTINELFLPDLMIATGSNIQGEFNAANNKLNLQMSSAEISYKTFKATELTVIVNENENTVLAEVSGRNLRITDSLNLANFTFAATSVDKHSSYSLDWDNLKSPVNKGEIKGQFSFGSSELSLLSQKIEITLNDSTWKLREPGTVLIDKTGGIAVESLVLSNNAQIIRIFGNLSGRVGDSLVVSTDEVILQQFNPLLKTINLKLEGLMNGNMAFSNAGGIFVFNGNLAITKLRINDNTIGALMVNTRYNATEKHILLNGYTSLGFNDELGNLSKSISFRGTYYLDRDDESIDIGFFASPANLSLLNPYLEGILTINKGFVNGEGRVHGTPKQVKIDGKFRLFNSEVRVDYTNVTYNITGDIEIMPDQIRFSDLLMREKGTKAAPQGTINGNIFHNNFGNMQLDYDITYRKMLVLNTTEKENNTFYGKVYGTGNVGIWGFVNNLNMKIVDTATKGSRFYMPLDGPAEIGDNDFIHFVKRDTIKRKKEKELTGFNLYMMLNATPDAQVQIILDKQNGDMLNVQGQGDLRLTVNTLGKFEMFGDYIITDGHYLFTLENVINKKFDIDAGSSISWSGNPTNAEINVTTSYKQRTSVAPLLNDTTGQYKGRYPVDCKLLITGKLFSPTINFDIEFPNLDATARARIDNVLSDEVELNRQVFSFLLFRSFIKPQIFSTTGGGVTPSGAAASTGSELLSNRVSEFLNTYVGNLTGINDLQLGLNYRPANQGTTEEVDLALSKQFLNNKVTVESNFGVTGNSHTVNNGLIGDLYIDYKLSEDGRYRLRGFNRSNDITQIATSGGPFTQGIGLFYREEFETFNQLFKRYLKKMKKNDPTKQ